MKNLLNERPDLDRLPAFNRFLAARVALEDLNGRKVLDLGCGFGWFCLHAKAAGAELVVGVEPDAASLSTARGLSAEGVRFEVADALSLSYPAHSFDTVVSWEVIEHIPRGTEPRYFAEVGRVLRPGGVFYLSTPFASLKSRLADPAWLLLGHRHYRGDELAKIAESSGFDVEMCQSVGSWGMALSHLNMYFSKWVLRRAPVRDEWFQRWAMRELESGNGNMSLVMKFRKKAEG